MVKGSSVMTVACCRQALPVNNCAAITRSPLLRRPKSEVARPLSPRSTLGVRRTSYRLAFRLPRVGSSASVHTTSEGGSTRSCACDVPLLSALGGLVVMSNVMSGG